MTQESASPGTVVQLIGSFGGGGAQRLALNLAQSIGSMGIRSVAIAMRDAGGFANNGAPHGAEVRSLGLRSSAGVQAVRAIALLRSQILDIQPDVVHVHGSSCLIAAAVSLRLIKERPRFVFTWHDSGSVVSRRLIRRVPTVWALRECDALLGSSRDVSMRLDQAVGDRGRAAVFVNGVPELSETPRIDEPDVSIVWAGRLVPEKDPESLLRCIARLRDHGVPTSVTLAGGSLPRHAAYESSVRALHHELKLESIVSLAGWVGEMETLYRHANVGVQTSRTEGLSMSLLEMMMAGLAIVATDVGDTATAVVDGQSGIIVPPGDEQAMFDALRTLSTNTALRKQLGRAARTRALELFSTDAMARRAVGVYTAARAGGTSA